MSSASDGTCTSLFFRVRVVRLEAEGGILGWLDANGAYFGSLWCSRDFGARGVPIVQGLELTRFWRSVKANASQEGPRSKSRIRNIEWRRASMDWVVEVI